MAQLIAGGLKTHRITNLGGFDTHRGRSTRPDGIRRPRGPARQPLPFAFQEDLRARALMIECGDDILGVRTSHQIKRCFERIRRICPHCFEEVDGNLGTNL